MNKLYNIAQLLIMRGAKRDTQDANGETPLQIARRTKYRPMVNLLTN